MKALVTRRQGEMSNTTSHQRGRYKKGDTKREGFEKGGQDSSGRARGRRKGKMANTASVQQGIYNEEGV